jgi:predicted Zn-dependent protease
MAQTINGKKTFFNSTESEDMNEKQHAGAPITQDTYAGCSAAGRQPEARFSFPALQGTDRFHLRIAEDWIGLGDYIAASEQLKKISSGFRAHPAVLKVQWQVCVNARSWEAALEVASTLAMLDPADSLGWSHQSFALHELRRTAEARDNLLQVADRFPDNPTMRYNLACYECQLGRTEEAKRWLAAAFQLGDKRRMAKAALTDSDLTPLQEWVRLESGSSSGKVSICDGMARLPHVAAAPRRADMIAAWR